MNKEELLGKLRRNTMHQFDMPEASIDGIKYENTIEQFIETSHKVGSEVIVAKAGASNIKGIKVDLNPDMVSEAQDLNGTDVGIVEGDIAVAENGCVWVPQTMKERVVCFVSENLVILVHRDKIVNNMHEAYRRIHMTEYGYGCFISGPSKTADIEQALVMGAQAARGVTVIIVD